MKIIEKVFLTQYPVINNFIYHYKSYKVLISEYEYLDGSREFWVRTTDAHLYTAAILWCMVFGTDSNSIHWKNTFEDSEKVKLIEEFKSIIFDKLMISKSEWAKYWSKMIDFRNNYIAHRALDFEDPIPYFEKAFEIAVEYELWIRKIIEPDIIDNATFVELSRKYELEIIASLKKCKPFCKRF